MNTHELCGQAYTKRKGSALIVTLFLTAIFMFVGLYLVDKIVPAGRMTVGIENGTVAYYQARSGLERALSGITRATPDAETGALIGTNRSSGTLYTRSASGNTFPPAGKGKSEFSADWDTISVESPMQININRAGINWTAARFHFRIPDFGRTGTYGQSLTGTGSFPAITWVLSSKNGKVLTASGSTNQITIDRINTSGSGGIATDLYTGVDLNGATQSFAAFLNTNCNATTTCTAKFIVTRPLYAVPTASPTTTPSMIPYLETQVSGLSAPLPLPVITAESEGYSAGFRKRASTHLPQFTTHSVFDFTIFQ